MEEGAPADLLLLDGKSLEKINSIADSAKFKSNHEGRRHLQGRLDQVTTADAFGSLP